MTGKFRVFEHSGKFTSSHHSKCNMANCYSSGDSQTAAQQPIAPFALLHADVLSTLRFEESLGLLSDLDTFKSAGMYMPIDDWFSTKTDLGAIPAFSIFISSSSVSYKKDLRPLASAIISLIETKAFYLIHNPAVNENSWARFCVESLSGKFSALGLELTRRLDSVENVHVYQIIPRPVEINKFFSDFGLDTAFASSQKIYLTTEDADLERAGGIGTYIKTLRSTLKIPPAVLYLGSSKGRLRDGMSLHWQDVFPEMSHQKLVQGPHLVELIRGLSAFMPHLSTVQVQDAGALGFRLIQAKNSGGLPEDLSIELFMHGGTDHVKFGVQNQLESSYSFDDLRNSTQELYAAGHADAVVAPSKFLADELESEFGYTLRNMRVSKLPYTESWPPPSSTFSRITEIAFVGKFSRLKGWNDFVEALEVDFLEGALGGVRKISAYGAGMPSDAEVKRLEKFAKFDFKFLGHDEFLNMILESRDDTLFVLPQRGENYPLTTLEMILFGARFIGYDAGGASEVVGLQEEDFLVKPNTKALATAIARELSLDISTSQTIRAQAQIRASGLQRGVNEKFSAETERTEASRITRKRENLSLAVATPVFRTPLDLLAQLAESLKGSSLAPTKWVLIDESSDEEYTRQLKSWVGELNMQIPVDVIPQEQIGLAGARNTGLSALTEDLVYFMDGDDLFLPSTLSDSKYALEHFPKLSAVAGFTYDLDHWVQHRGRDGRNPQSPNWMPLGVPEARSISLARNEFIPASSCVRRSAVLAQGGWDGTDRAAWEDWAFYSNLAWNGVGFSLLPHSGYLYRDTPGSMSKTLNNYFGFRRLARNLPSFTKHDANVILSFAQNPTVTGSSSGPRHFVLAVMEKFIEKNANRWVGRTYRWVADKFPVEVRNQATRIFK